MLRANRVIRAQAAATQRRGEMSSTARACWTNPPSVHLATIGVVGVVVAVDVWRQALEPCEPQQGEHLPHSVQLHDTVDPVAERRTAPRTVGDPPGVEVQVNRDVVIESLWLRQDRVELNLFDRAFLLDASVMAGANCCEHVRVGEPVESLGDVRDGAECL